MSLGREVLRNTIRTLAFPTMLLYVLYKMYLQAKDKPGTKKLIEAYRKLYTVIKTRFSQKEQDKPHNTEPDQDEWSYN